MIRRHNQHNFITFFLITFVSLLTGRRVIELEPRVVIMSRLLVLGMLPLVALAASEGAKGADALSVATKVRRTAANVPSAYNSK